MMDKTSLVAQPNFVDGFIFARRDAFNFIITFADIDVAANRTLCTHRRVVIQFKHARSKTKIARRERADGTDINRVARKIGIERRVVERGNFQTTSTVRKTQHRFARDFILETHTARALNTTFAVEHDERRKRHRFFVVKFGFDVKTRFPRSVMQRVVLEGTFTALVANGTIERMTRQQKFDDAFARINHLRRRCANRHAFGNNRRAARLQFRHPIDDGCAVFIQHGLFRRGVNARRANIHQTHAAHADGLHFGMITKNRNMHAKGFRRFDDERACGDLNIFSVNGYFGHLDKSYFW